MAGDALVDDGRPMDSGAEPRPGISGRWRIWNERRLARRNARAALADFLRFARAWPTDGEREALYVAWVQHRQKLSLIQARRVVDQAEASFAAWPETCELRLQHVLQYVIVNEYLAQHPEFHGASADMAVVVRDEVPRQY